jgi:polypyrimidine tract-binding protein 2
MESIQSATTALMFSQTQPLLLKGLQVNLSYSHSQDINRSNRNDVRTYQVGPYAAMVSVAHAASSSASSAASPFAGMSGAGGGAMRARPASVSDGGSSAAPTSSKILLLTILNPVYNISCDVLHQIMSPYGNVLRIVVFMKNGVQAMVEFDSEASAGQALRALDGRDIYAGSCTLKIVYSRVQGLNVKHNDERSRDYTRPDLPTTQLMLPTMAHMAAFHGQMLQQQVVQQQVPHHVRAMMGMVVPGAAGAGGGVPVVIVHGMRGDLSCDHVFNVFGNFGNIVRIKQLVNSPTVRLVEFADPAGAEAAVRMLKDTPLFDETLRVHLSKHPTIVPSPDDHAAAAAATLAEKTGVPSATPSNYKDFSASPLNRFRRPTLSSSGAKSICQPGETLHFTNFPADATEASCSEYLVARGAPKPERVLFFDGFAQRRSGLVEFRSVADAMQALVYCNNIPISDQVTFKLSFTPNHINVKQQDAAPTTTTTATTTAAAAETVAETVAEPAKFVDDVAVATTEAPPPPPTD